MDERAACAGVPRAQVALFSENSSRWLVADQAVMVAGAADAVRGAASPADEMGYIVRHSDAAAIVCQDSATLERLAPVLATTSGSSASQNGNGAPGSNGRGAANGSSNGAAEVRGTGVLRLKAGSIICGCLVLQVSSAVAGFCPTTLHAIMQWAR